MEETLQEQTALISALLSTTSDAVLVTDLDGVVLEANERLAQRLRATLAALRGANIYDFLPPALAQLRRERVQAVIASKQPAQFEDQIGEQWLEHTFAPIVNEYGEVEKIVACSRDIIERKQAEESVRQSEERFRRLVENMPVLINAFGADGTYVFWNTACERATGYTAAEMLGNPAALRLLYPDPAYLQSIVTEWAARGSRFINWELTLTDKHGQPKTIAWSNLADLFPIPGWASWAIGIDVTERKRMEADLHASLKEKEALLREIHHRVKNNLQVVSSMLYLQAEAARDEHTQQSLQESQNRIQAMALVHEQLYASDNLAEIDMAQYLEELATAMYHAYHVNIEQIRLQLDVTPLMLSIEQAIPCGLIVQELVSNAFKHGFPSGQRGQVGVACQRDEDRVTLKVWNSGTPFPEQINLRKVTTIGLDLVHSFTRQLRGTLELDRTRGTCFTVSFPVRNR